jgi:hypothetical protein
LFKEFSAFQPLPSKSFRICQNLSPICFNYFPDFFQKLFKSGRRQHDAFQNLLVKIGKITQSIGKKE